MYDYLCIYTISEYNVGAVAPCIPDRSLAEDWTPNSAVVSVDDGEVQGTTEMTGTSINGGSSKWMVYRGKPF